MDKMEELNNMDKTKELIKMQHDALVDVINYLDSTKQSNTKIRETVDRALNGSDWKDLEVQSSLEVHNAEVIYKRYIKQLKKIEALRNIIEEKRIDEGGWR
jgi:acyl CoA:acetate/3-ketoacid CoA transferase|tara:strand:+ start:227 stop:529 length:303 start_codon:yes stop_codon:yes gene_type:complete